MTTERVTVSLPPEVLALARSAVAAGASDSVSAYVAEAMVARQSKTEALSRLEDVLGRRPGVEALNEVRGRLGLPLLPTA